MAPSSREVMNCYFLDHRKVQHRELDGWDTERDTQGAQCYNCFSGQRSVLIGHTATTLTTGYI